MEKNIEMLKKAIEDKANPMQVTDCMLASARVQVCNWMCAATVMD